MSRMTSSLDHCPQWVTLLDRFMRLIPTRVGAGAFCFGAVVGWITKEATIRTDNFSVGTVSSVIGVVGGAAVTAIFKADWLFANYCIGLALGFFAFTLLFDIDPETGRVKLVRSGGNRRSPPMPTSSS
jgi:hypothetical protein